MAEEAVGHIVVRFVLVAHLLSQLAGSQHTWARKKGAPTRRAICGEWAVYSNRIDSSNYPEATLLGELRWLGSFARDKV